MSFVTRHRGHERFTCSVMGLTTSPAFFQHRTAEQWASAYIAQIYPDWGLPFIFIHDVDPKLMSELWQSLCRTAGIQSHTSAAYHQQANGQIERTVQTVVHSLRTLIGAKYDQRHWPDLMPHLTHCLTPPFILRQHTQPLNSYTDD